jgi:hypothetical protein
MIILIIIIGGYSINSLVVILLVVIGGDSIDDY